MSTGENSTENRLVALRDVLTSSARIESSLRTQLYGQVRGTLGLPAEIMAPCTDPAESFLPVESIVRELHYDLSVMVIGGLTALFLQTLHPGVMAGVADHSAFEDDPFGRLARTARFLALTTYGTEEEAAAAIAQVRRVHNRIRGVDAFGRPYCANDPDLLTWVHASEVYGFLTAAIRYGPRRLSPDDQDEYLRDMATVAGALGAADPPRTRSELDAYFSAHREPLVLTDAARRTRNYLLKGVRHRPHEVAVYSLLVATSLNLVPRWARSLLGIPVVPVVGRTLVQPAAATVSRAVRAIAPQAA